MAKMIPPSIDSSTPSSAERRLFNLLKNDPDTGGWTVLHSLGLAHRQGKPYGEIDFVVIVPEGGVVCLEVKGGKISCREGIWFTRGRSYRECELKKSPFLQAREGMFALRDAIISKFGRNSEEGLCPCVYGVVFPDVMCPPVTPEFERADVIDSDDLRMPISISVTRILQNQLKSYTLSKPLSSTLKNIRTYLRPDFDLVITRSTMIRRAEEEIIRLTSEQCRRLDELEENPRCFFEGAAGTGKTLLACEFARRSALKGDSVLFLCYNRTLGGWLKHRMEETMPGGSIRVGSFFQVLRSVILESDYSEEYIESENNAASDDFVDNLILFGLMALENIETPYDTVVIDEAQDLIGENTLDIFDLWLRGGLAGGKWAFFGDFCRQDIYGDRSMAKKNIDDRRVSFVRARLSRNCRNSKQIATETAYISGFDNLPYHVTDQEGLPVQYYYWKSHDMQAARIEEVIQKMLNEDVAYGDIVVLGMKKLENSVLKDRIHIGGLRILDISGKNDFKVPGKTLLYSTVHSFKGMESPVVLLADVSFASHEEIQSLLYVGMSRARSLLCVFFDEKVRKYVQERVQLGIIRELKK